jgi:hypothetical protein
MTQTKESSHTEIQTSDFRPPNSISLSHHQRRCGICRHPDRHWIEEDILHWRSYFDIEHDYDLKDRSSIYRHARALGLFALRKRNLRSALELLIERAGDIRPSAAGLVSVIRAYTCLTDDGRWIDRPKHAIITHVTAPADPGIGYTPPRKNLPHDASGGGRTQPVTGDTRDHDKPLPQAAPPGLSPPQTPEAAADVPEPQLASSDASPSLEDTSDRPDAFADPALAVPKAEAKLAKRQKRQADRSYSLHR